MPLTDTAIRNTRSRQRPFKVSDSGGLYLLVKETGRKLWRMDYAFAGKRKTLSFGIYPHVTLADARQLRDAAKRRIAHGSDPSLDKRKEKLAARMAGENTFGAIADEYLTKLSREGRATATLDKNR